MILHFGHASPVGFFHPPTVAPFTRGVAATANREPFTVRAVSATAARSRHTPRYELSLAFAAQLRCDSPTRLLRQTSCGQPGFNRSRRSDTTPGRFIDLQRRQPQPYGGRRSVMGRFLNHACAWCALGSAGPYREASAILRPPSVRSIGSCAVRQWGDRLAPFLRGSGFPRRSPLKGDYRRSRFHVSRLKARHRRGAHGSKLASRAPCARQPAYASPRGFG